MKRDTFQCRVYYEDTDLAGIVYYANYLKYLERARSEAIYSVGLTNIKLQKDYGVLIIVKSCNIEYKKPAKFEDKIQIISKINEVRNSSFKNKRIVFQKNAVMKISIVTICKMKISSRFSKE